SRATRRDAPVCGPTSAGARYEWRDGSELPPRMDCHKPAENRLHLRALEPGFADHPFELRHRREASNRFDEVAIAVRVMRNRLADLRHDLVRIEVVGVLEAGPLGGRELEAEEPAAELEDAERLCQRPVDVRHVADAEGDRVSVEAAVRIAQRLGVLA